MVKLSELLTGDPSKYHIKVGEGFPTVSQEQLSWAPALVQLEEGRISGANEILAVKLVLTADSALPSCLL